MSVTRAGSVPGLGLRSGAGHGPGGVGASGIRLIGHTNVFPLLLMHLSGVTFQPLVPASLFHPEFEQCRVFSVVCGGLANENHVTSRLTVDGLLLVCLQIWEPGWR